MAPPGVPQAIPGSLVDGGAEDEELRSRWLRAKGEAKALTERVKADANEIKARIATNAGLRLRGMQGVAFYENRKASPSWKNAARELAQRVADLTSGNVEELLEDARAKSVPPVGPRSLRWSSKLNPAGFADRRGGAEEEGRKRARSAGRSKQTVLDVLEALAGLRFHLKEDRRPKIEEIPEVEARWSALSIDEKARLLELANSEACQRGSRMAGQDGEPRRRP